MGFGGDIYGSKVFAMKVKFGWRYLSILLEGEEDPGFWKEIIWIF